MVGASLKNLKAGREILPGVLLEQTSRVGMHAALEVIKYRPASIRSPGFSQIFVRSSRAPSAFSLTA